MKKLLSFLAGVVVVTLIVIPVITFAQTTNSTWFGLVPCTEPDFPGTKGGTATLGGDPKGVVCDWNALVMLAQRLMNFAIMLSVPIGGATFAYAGFLLVTAGPDTGAREKAKGLIWNVVIGMLITLSAWLIVYLITSSLLRDSSYSILKSLQN